MNNLTMGLFWFVLAIALLACGTYWLLGQAKKWKDATDTAILATLKGGKQLTSGEIMDLTGLSPWSFGTYVGTLVAEGRVIQGKEWRINDRDRIERIVYFVPPNYTPTRWQQHAAGDRDL